MVTFASMKPIKLFTTLFGWRIKYANNQKKIVLVNQMVNYADHVSVTFMGDHKRLISKAATDVRWENWQLLNLNGIILFD